MLIHALFPLALALSSPTPAVAFHPPVLDSVVPRHATFGVAIAPAPEAYRKLDYLEPNEGVLLVQVQPGGAADAAHLKAGDLVLGVDGKRVDETTLFATLRAIPRGQSFKVEYLRNDKWYSTTATIDP